VQEDLFDPEKRQTSDLAERWSLTAPPLMTDLCSTEMQTPAALAGQPLLVGAMEGAGTPKRSPVSLNIGATWLLLNASYWHTV